MQTNLLLPTKFTVPDLTGIHLSKREKEVLFLIVRGQTAKSIAKLLVISPRTVEQYTKNIKIKMNVFSKAQLIDKVLKCYPHLLIDDFELN